jgi:hypothetical protein
VAALLFIQTVLDSRKTHWHPLGPPEESDRPSDDRAIKGQRPERDDRASWHPGYGNNRTTIPVGQFWTLAGNFPLRREQGSLSGAPFCRLTVCQNSSRLLRERNPAYAPRTGIHYRHPRYDWRRDRATSCRPTQCRATKSHWFYPHSRRIGHNDSRRLGDIRQVQVNLLKGRMQNPTWPYFFAFNH